MTFSRTKTLHSTLSTKREFPSFPIKTTMEKKKKILYIMGLKPP